MVAASVSVPVFEIALVGVFLFALLLGVTVGWQSRGHLEYGRRGNDVDLTGARRS